LLIRSFSVFEFLKFRDLRLRWSLIREPASAMTCTNPTWKGTSEDLCSK
jgi:hypothetical protein